VYVNAGAGEGVGDLCDLHATGGFWQKCVHLCFSAEPYCNQNCALTPAHVFGVTFDLAQCEPYGAGNAYNDTCKSTHANTHTHTHTHTKSNTYTYTCTCT
jgi:hypothetical protein